MRDVGRIDIRRRGRVYAGNVSQKFTLSWWRLWVDGRFLPPDPRRHFRPRAYRSTDRTGPAVLRTLFSDRRSGLRREHGPLRFSRPCENSSIPARMMIVYRRRHVFQPFARNNPYERTSAVQIFASIRCVVKTIRVRVVQTKKNLFRSVVLEHDRPGNESKLPFASLYEPPAPLWLCRGDVSATFRL